MNMFARRLAVFGTAVAVGAVGFAGPASAAPPYAPPEVSYVSAVTLAHNAGRAFITATYKCSGGRTGTHLWVSAKQGPNISPPDHTSSSDAKSWYDTNWNFEKSPAGLTVNCDGHWRTTTYVLKPEFGQLHKGRAFVQFCLFDSTADPNSTDHGFAFSYTMQQVHET
jgi:hypothetical protein